MNPIYPNQSEWFRKWLIQPLIQNFWKLKNKSTISRGIFKIKFCSPLTKVSVWNSFRTNPKFSESFRNLYPHQTVSFRTNPKLVFNPSSSEAQIKSIRTCNPNESGQSEWIRINPNFQSEWIWSIWINSNFQSEWIRAIWINPNDSEKFGFILIDRIARIHWDWSDRLDSFGLKIWILINSDWLR